MLIVVIGLFVFEQVACSQCSEMMEREILAIHRGENCPQRIVTCEFCEFPLPAIDLAEHQVVIISNFIKAEVLSILYFDDNLDANLSCFVTVGSLWEPYRTLSSV